MIKGLLGVIITLSGLLIYLDSKAPEMQLVPQKAQDANNYQKPVASVRAFSLSEKPVAPAPFLDDNETNEIHLGQAIPKLEKTQKVSNNPKFYAKVKPFLDKYCVDCHGPKKKKSGLRVDTLSTVLDDADLAEEWQHILDELNGATMPPEDEPQPSDEELTDILEVLTFEIDQAKKKLYGKNTETVMRRLNKREYINTIEEITGVRLKENDVPQDGKSGAFDTDGKGLFMSSYQFERYMELARKALDQAIVTGPKPKIINKTFQPESGRNQTVQRQLKRIPEIIKKSVKKNRNAESDLKAYITYSQFSAAKTGAIISPHLCFSGSRGFFTDLNFNPLKSKDFKAGTYKIKITCGQGNLAKESKALLNLDLNYKAKTHKDFIKYYEVTGTVKNPQRIEIEIYLDQYNGLKIDSIIKKSGKEIPYIWIDKIEVSGPYYEKWPPESHQKILGKSLNHKNSTSHASRIISSFTKKAFQHKTPTAKFMNTMNELFKENSARGMKFEDAIKEPLAVIMSSPKFLYMVEPHKENKGKIVPDYELASRLSYFLWSSKPDSTLLDLAKKGQLRQPEILKTQIQRMLKDKRSFALASGFVPQWIHLDKFDEVDVNKRKFPEFNPTVGKNMKLETIHFFDTIMKQNLSMTNFINSDFITVNNILKAYYGIPSNGKDDFEVVKLPKSSPRGGLLGMGAIQVMTGNGERTSPVLRGTFVLNKIIGTPAPEPPPNVPQLENAKTKNLTVREALKVHQEHPQCSSCHRRIDPLGFGLENFDAAGKWRDGAYQGKRKNRKLVPMDTKGSLPDGAKYSDVYQFKTGLLKYKNSFGRSLIESLMEYALGRRVGFADAQLVDHLVAKAEENNFRLADAIEDIIFSKQFRTK